MKGQASVELLITLGVVIAFTIPVLLLLLSLTQVGQEQTAAAQAQASARSLSDTMNRVYAMGPSSKRVMYMNVPSSTQGISIEGGEVIVTISTSYGKFDAVSPTFAEVNDAYDSIYDKSGLFPLVVESDAQGRVMIYER